MPSYIVTGPDGAKYRVNAPEGASEADAISYAQKNLAAPAPTGPTGGLKRVYITGEPPAAEAGGDDLMSIAADAVKSLGIGTVKGGIGLVGAAGDVRGLASKGLDAAGEYLGVSPETISRGKEAAYNAAQYFPTGQVLSRAPSSGDIQQRIEQTTGEFYQPQTKVGEYAQTVGEFLPAAVGGQAGLAGRAARVLAPALTSETFGQVTKGEPIEPLARFLGALTGGGAQALLSRPNTTRAVLENQLPRGVTPQMVDQADVLMQDAAQRGVQLTWPEALSQVAGRPVLTDLQRHLEASARSAPQMQDFFAGRPQQVQRAVEAEAANLSPGPPPVAPSTIGPAVRDAAGETVQGVRNAITTATRPLYDAAGQHLVPPRVHAAMMDDALFAETVNEIRNTPALNAVVRAASDRSVAMYDAVAKRLEERARAAASPLNPDASQLVSSTTGSLGGGIKDVAIAAERAATQGPSAYEAALARQTELRERYLNPLLEGHPLGRLAKENTTTKKAIEILFPRQPVARTEQEVSEAVRAVANRSPKAASDLVRAHVETAFDQAARDLQSGPNQAGGAKFRALIAGSGQQRANLQAAVEALPNGADRWRGFNRLLDVLEATGTRQNIGSRTAYNQEIQQAMGTAGGVVPTLAKSGGSPTQFFKPLVDKYELWRSGRQLGQLATAITDRNTGGMLRELARLNPTSRRAADVSRRLVAYLNASRPQAEQPTQ
ncbi:MULTISPECIES: hypothetical protein [unclassified Bradyrhizobium]|uniref:hypothetical protein n=1 Tax=unclassified Bradyrhizobium TaxID=2631580 RepID=UPI002FF3A22E